MSIQSLQVALRSLAAQQTATDVLNHNIANANTPGYSRQRVNFVASPPYMVSTMAQGISKHQVGGGVEVASIERLHDMFVDAQLRAETRSLAEAEVRQATYDKLQIIFREPSDSSLAADLDRFWGAWHDLSGNPGDRAAQAAVLEQGLQVAGLFNQSYRQVAAARDDMATLASLKVTEANSIAQQLAALNSQIQRAQLTGARANDLLDRRDLLLDQLSGLLAVRAVFNKDETVALFVDGQELVNGPSTRALKSSVDASFVLRLEWADKPGDVNPGGGSLSGALTSANTALPGRLAQLNTLAAQLRDEVNAIHTTGFKLNGSAGGPFFAGSGAGDLRVDTAIQADVGAIAAAGQPGAPGDNAVALAIAQLGHATSAVAATSPLKSGATLPASGLTIQRLLVTGASPGATYQLSSSAPGQLTLTATIAGVPVSQTVAVSDMTAPGTRVLDFSSLGVSIVLNGGGPSATAAAITGDLTTVGLNQVQVIGRTPVETGYQQLVVQLGVDARSAEADVANQETLLGNLKRQRESIRGVSIDEEAASLVRYLRAYQAAARVITAIDEMLETVIRSMGVTGRL